MKVMVLIKADKESEAGVMPDSTLLSKMSRYNEELTEAGIMVEGKGLQPTSKGKRIKLSGEKKTVIDGPFPYSNELIAGFWIWNVRSMDEAVEWVKLCPNPANGETEIEIRQLFETKDLR